MHYFYVYEVTTVKFDLYFIFFVQIEMDPLDKQLLEDEPQNQQDTRRSSQHKQVLPWMRKTEVYFYHHFTCIFADLMFVEKNNNMFCLFFQYISSEINRYGKQTERGETKVGFKIKKQMDDEVGFGSNNSKCVNI